MKNQNKPSIMNYLNSRDFIIDFMVVKTGENEVEWTVHRSKPGKKMVWLNGTLYNVISAVRKHGTLDEFAKYVTRTLNKGFKSDPEFRYCEEEIKSCIGCLYTTKKV